MFLLSWVQIFEPAWWRPAVWWSLFCNDRSCGSSVQVLLVLKVVNVACWHRTTELWYNLGISIFCYFIHPLHYGLEARVVISTHFIYLITSVTSYSEDNMQHQSQSSIFFLKVNLFLLATDWFWKLEKNAEYMYICVRLTFTFRYQSNTLISYYTWHRLTDKKHYY